jgi:HAD superfamily phosphoserine phosphatase-like hydrolase
MNGYDFDNTIYNGDSFVHFYFYTILKRPFLILIAPFQMLAGSLFGLRIIRKKQLKQCLMFNLKFFSNKEKLLTKFWDKHIKNLKPWYLEQKQANDIIISASPEFLVKHACDRLGLKFVYGTNMNIKTQKIQGENCWGDEKVKRFEKEFGKNVVLKTFYSDSLSDMPMMQKAEQGIFVKGNQREIIYQSSKS